jgi:hypothetical protein
MAQIERTDLDALDRKFFYNVSLAVGPKDTAPNRRDDVLLVQYLLKGIAERSKDETLPFSNGWVPPPTVTGKPFQVDGVVGRDTAVWIQSYQDAVAKAGPSMISADGRVDRALGVISSISHTVYTILYLNIEFGNVQYKKFKVLEDDVEAPPELRVAIRTSRALFMGP